MPTGKNDTCQEPELAGSPKNMVPERVVVVVVVVVVDVDVVVGGGGGGGGSGKKKDM